MRYSQTLNIDKARKELGYSPKMSILEGVKNYVEHSKKMIEKVDYFACGYCTNDLKRVFKGFD